MLLVGGGIGYYFHTPLVKVLKAPLHGPLYYTSPAGGFNFIMKICFMIGTSLALPVLIYNLAAFVQPAFANHFRQKDVRLVTLFSFFLAIAGAAFAFFAIVPISLHFFKGFDSAGVTSLISANDYLNFVINTIITFMIMFQMPVLMLFINRVKPLSIKKLLKYEKFVIAGSAIIALLLPFTYDPLTQFLVALPAIVLYNISILLVFMINSKKRRVIKPR